MPMSRFSPAGVSELLQRLGSESYMGDRRRRQPCPADGKGGYGGSAQWAPPALFAPGHSTHRTAEPRPVGCTPYSAVALRIQSSLGERILARPSPCPKTDLETEALAHLLEGGRLGVPCNVSTNLWAWTRWPL